MERHQGKPIAIVPKLNYFKKRPKAHLAGVKFLFYFYHKIIFYSSQVVGIIADITSKIAIVVSDVSNNAPKPGPTLTVSVPYHEISRAIQ